MIREPAENFIGKIFGLLTVIKDMGFSPKGRSVMCLCECGKEYQCRLYTLKRGDSVSCGCYKKMKVTVHGLKEHPTYRHWCAMKVRCYNKKQKAYDRYGGRGIIVCDEWLNDFKVFYDWAISSGWRKGLSLDRFPNNDGNYEPSNCRWATAKQQNRNTRGNHWIEYNGERKIAKDWADEVGITIHHLLKRIKDGWPLEKVMTSFIYDSKGRRTTKKTSSRA